MAGIENNLYPPVVNSWAPAFVRTTACRIYFSLSTYNRADDIKNVQIVISNQNTNLSALSSNLYPAGIKIAPLEIDRTVEGDNKYFITISPKDLQSGVFELNQFYKVQLRFTGAKAANLTDNKKIAAWLVNNQKFFSEWSRICLIKGIEQPTVYLKNFEEATQDAIFTSEVIDFVGGLYYKENAELEKETLKSYVIKIYNRSDDSLIYDSGDIYTNVYNPNEINYTLKIFLEEGVGYRLVLTYTTTNEYTNKIEYTFSILQNTIDKIYAKISATPEEEFGRIKVNVSATIAEVFFGNLIIRRTSNESDFTIWEDIHQTSNANGSVLNYDWYDYTIKSGVWYKYCIQKRDSKGNRSTAAFIRQPVMIVFDDMFLTRANMQLRIRYNPTISSFKTTLLESKTDTLGSKYPIIRRNGNVKYRQFPISGLITAFCDEEGIFLNKENIYGNAITYYDNYNDVNDIDEYQDFIYEREFREKVMDFLHDDTIKLFRSTTEGNILVKLMDISFTPNQTLGRMLYTFSATAYEIDDCSLFNFNKYGIQSIGELQDVLTYNFSKIGQVQGTYVGQKEDVFKVIQQKYEDAATEKYVNTVNYLQWVRIEFNMAPYLIKTLSNGALTLLPAHEQPNEDTILGYIVYINNKPTVVSSRRIYELLDTDTNVTSIYFPVESDVTVDYMVNIDWRENLSMLFDKIYFYTKVGQIRDSFQPNNNIFLQIYEKYYTDYTAYQQHLTSLNKVVVETTPGAVLYIQDSFDEGYFKHEINSTGVLEFYDSEATITGMYFGGIQLYETNDDLIGPAVDIRDESIIILKDNVAEVLNKNIDMEFNRNYFTVKNESIIVRTGKNTQIRDNEFVIVNTYVASLDQVENPIRNGVYTVDGKRYIYYREQWYPFSDDNMVQCPIDASIDYICELMKGEHYK